MIKKLAIIALTFCFAIVVLSVGFSLIFSDDVNTNSYEELPMAEMAADHYPWSRFEGVVTSVIKYQDAYDLDSNDWIAHFYLKPEEAATLKSLLVALPIELKTSYRCAHAIAKDWAPESVCKAAEMERQGFEGYFYNPSLCEAGCKQSIVMWMKTDGEAFIVGSPASEE